MILLWDSFCKLLSSNLFSGFAGVCIGGFITYFINNKVEEKRLNEKQKLLYSVLNDILKQVKVILVGTFEGAAKSPYGYYRNPHTETKAIIPLFDNLISEVSILPSSKNKTLLIELYTELKDFIYNNENYKIRLENLRLFRKEMMPDNFTTLNCKNYMDYFDVDIILFNEERKLNSLISKDFFKAQRTLIDNLCFLSDLTEKTCANLIFKIDDILSNSWENKNDRK